jgi:hypothetical protein
MGAPVPVTQEPSAVEREPVAAYTAVATVVALAAGAFGIVVDPGTLVTAALAIVGFGSYLVAAYKARKKVTPVEFPKFNSEV